MKAALTLDDLPHWPEYPYPQGHSARSVADALIDGFGRHGLKGIYAFANSKPFVDDPTLTTIMDDWLAAGHHIGNHTHSHIILHQTSLDEYIANIDLADELLAPWIDKAPNRYFRYTWNIRGETEEKRVAVKTHIEALNYQPAECSSWFFEWDWDKAYVSCLERGDIEGITFLKQSFLEFAQKQLEHDDAGMQQIFGRAVPHILLLHNLSFVEEIFDDFLTVLENSGLKFVSLEEAIADNAYAQAGVFPCGEFLVYWRKLLWRDGVDSLEVPPGQLGTYNRVLEMANSRL